MSDTQRTQLRHTAELFPDELVESEIGEVPKGWGVSEIGKEVNSVGGTTPRTKNPKYWDGGKIAWTTPKDLSNANSKILLETDRKITDEGLDQISSGLLPINTVLMSSRAPVGYLALSKIPVAINQGYVAMICDQILTPEYVLHWTESNMDIIKQHAGGSTFAEISKRDFRPLPVLVPNKEVLNAYSDKAGSLYDLITANMNENKTLENIRDTLLPRLISGEIQI
jgi:type I restriction enzyme S subunit